MSILPFILLDVAFIAWAVYDSLTFWDAYYNRIDPRNQTPE